MREQKNPEDQSHLVLWRHLRMVARLLFRARMLELAPCGISVRQAAMLSGVKALGDEATPASIARRQYRDPSSVSNILIRMERMGLVRRRDDPNHGRKVRITLTAKGEDLYQRSTEYARLKEVFSALTDEECTSLTANLKKLREAARSGLQIRGRSGHGSRGADD